MLKGSKLTWDAVWECVKCCAKFEKWNNAGTWLEIFLSPSPSKMYKARQVDIYCLKVFVCFLGELRTPSFTFEIIWPLVTFFVKIYWCCGVYEHRMARWYFLKSNNLPHAASADWPRSFTSPWRGFIPTPTVHLIFYCWLSTMIVP